VIVGGLMLVVFATLSTLGALRDDELTPARIVLVVVFAACGVGLVRGLRVAYWITSVGVGAIFLVGALSLLDEISVNRVIGALLIGAVPALLLLSPSARAWARPRAPATIENGSGKHGLPPVEGWHRPRLGGRLKFWFLVLVGVLLVLGGVAMALSGGEERGPGVVIALFGLGLLLTTPLFKTWRSRGTPIMQTIDRGGRARTGLGFPYSRGLTRASAYASLCMGLASGGFVLFAEEFADQGESKTPFFIFGTLGAVLFLGGGIVMLIRNSRQVQTLTLLPEGVQATAAGTNSFVPWDAIAWVEAFDFTFYSRGFANHEPYVGIKATDPQRIEISKTGRMLMKTNSMFGTDLAYPVRTLNVEPALLLHALRYYLENPNSRPELGGPEALQRVEKLMAGN
jgi:hypothetical protein